MVPEGATSLWIGLPAGEFSYQVTLPGNRTAWTNLQNMRYVPTAKAPPPKAGVPPRAGLTSCAGKIEGRYALSGGLGSMTIIFRSGKALLPEVIGNGPPDEYECWTGGGKIILHQPGNPNHIPDMDLDGIDAAFLYPSLCLGFGGVEDPALAAALYRAYNRWLADYCKPYPDRLFGVAMLPLQSIEAAIDEMRFARKDLGFRAGFIRPNPYGGRHVDDPWYDPLWKAAAELGVPVGFHPLAMWDMPGATLHFDFPDISYAAAAGFTLDSMLTLTHLIFSGVLDRFRDLQVIVLESSGGWVYTWLERLAHHMKILPSLRPAVKRGAIEQFHDQVWVSFDPDEKALPAMVGLLGDQRFVWASDYPHFDATFPGATAELREVIAPLPEESQRRILGENARRLYRI